MYPVCQGRMSEKPQQQDRTPTVNVEPEALQRFRTAVFNTHGKLHGAMQFEATAAIVARTAVLEGALAEKEQRAA